MKVQAPARNPCGSCPYRRDVPAGVWHPDEYAKLLRYDLPTAEQPIGLFLCHQQNQRVCAGWVGTHDMNESLAIRIAASLGKITAQVIQAILAYASTVPLWGSGREAAAHGMSRIESPPEKARRIMDKITRKRET